MPCQLQVGDRTHTGLVLDLSRSGLFIQTHAKVRRGERFALAFAGMDGASMELLVEVVRTKVVPPRLLAVAGGGVGVRIARAPEAYYQLLADLGLDARGRAHRDRDVEVAPEADAGPRFRVHVSQTSGPRSRRLEVSAPDADAARDRALEQMGEGWKVLGVEPV